MQSFPKAFCGYNANERAYIPYQGNLTQRKKEEICKLLESHGFRPGWPCTNVRVQPPDDKHGLNVYKEDGASGITKVTVLNL